MKVALTDVEQLTGEYYFLRGIFEQLVASINAALNAGGDGTKLLLNDGQYRTLTELADNITAAGGTVEFLPVVRRSFYQDVTTTGVAGTYNLTLDTTLTDYTKAIVLNNVVADAASNEGMQRWKLTSNTNLQYEKFTSNKTHTLHIVEFY